VQARQPARAEAQPQGKRDRNKQDKLRRIKAAARRIFAAKGFDAATVREIAAAAGVAFGTVFLYARDKRDLLFLIYNEPHLHLIDGAIEGVPRDARSMPDAFVALFRPFYEFYLKEGVELSRAYLRELQFYGNTREAELFQVLRRRFRGGVQAVVERLQAQKQITGDADAELIAATVFDLYAAEVRAWLHDPSPDLRKGLARLRRVLALFYAGCRPRSARRRAVRGARRRAAPAPRVSPRRSAAG